MKNLFGDLIILSPASSKHVLKFRFTRTAILILVLSCFLSFGVVVAIGYAMPMVPESDHLRLEKENMELKISNKNAALGVSRLADTTDRMEAQTKRIQDLMERE